VKSCLFATDLSRAAAAVFAAVWIAAASAPRLTAADDIHQRSRAMYGELRAYADTGVVLEECGSATKDRHTFATL
jgi:hypothetical protein